MPHPNALPPAFILAFVQSVFLLFLGVDFLRHETIDEIFQEGHAIETMSALTFLLASGLLVLQWRDPVVRRHWHLIAILALMGLRELDLDKGITSEGILQLRLYTGSAPWFEKLAGACVVVLILWCGWRLLRYTLAPFWRGLRAAHPASWLSLGAGGAITVAKGLDGIGRKLADYGIIADPVFLREAGRAEEMLEVIAGIMLVMAVSYYAKHAAWAQMPRAAA